jgi:hypothetical protein
MGGKVILVLQLFGDVTAAAKVADDIRNRGEITYTDAEGANVSVTVGSITVEEASTEPG